MNNYNPDLCIGDFDGVELNSGIAKGTFFKGGYNTDRFSMSVGGDGEVTRVESKDKTARYTVTLKAGSSANDLLSAKANLGKAGPLLFKDLNGTTLAHSQNAWPVKVPDIERSNEDTNVEWVFDCADLEVTVGGFN